MAAWMERRGQKITVRWQLGSKHGRRTVPDVKTARQLIREIETCHALGKLWQPLEKSYPIDPCLTELLTDRIEQGRRIRRPNTLKNWRASFALFVDFLRLSRPRGKLRLELLTPRTLYAFHAWLIDVRGNRPNVALLRLTHIRAAWRWASTSQGWHELTPAYLEVELPLAPPPRRKMAPYWVDADAMIAHLESKRVTKGGKLRRPAEAVYRAAVLMRYTGIRSHQAARIEWIDLCFIERTLTVRGEIGKSRHERAGRTVPVSPHLLEEIAAWGVRDGLVSGLPEPVSRITLSHNIRKAWEASGVAPDVWGQQTQHALRRAFTSELVRRGADRFAIEILLGRSTGVGGDVYTDPRFVWDRLDHAVSLVTRIGDSNQTQLSGRKSSEGRD